MPSVCTGRVAKMGIKNQPIIRSCPQCGRNYHYRRASGRTFELCEYCRNLDCVICCKKVPLERGRKNTCCAECEKLKIHNIQNAHYAKRIAENPEINISNHAKARKNRKADPERMRKHLKAQRERHYRRMQDPTYQAVRKTYQANRWQDKKDDIKAQRREFWDSLSDIEKAERLERNQVIQRKHKAKKREQLKLDPQKWAEYQEYQRTKQREHRQRKALNKLMTCTKELLNVTNKDK